ncbi:MAG: HlyD family efflux transporter periplasmic adaptor subunit [Thermodesulfobacteriota bacterium]
MQSSIKSLVSPLRKHFVLVGGVCLLAGVAFLTTGFLNHEEAKEQRPQKTVRVVKQSFSLQVTERGVVRPARVRAVKSSLSGNMSKLVWMVDEGERITKGQIIARFDTKPFMDILEKAEQELRDARAQLIVSTKSLELQKEEESSKIEAAKRDLEIATIEADDLKNGSGPLKRRQLEQKVKQAERSHGVAAGELEDFRKLLDKGHVTLREFEVAQGTLLTAREELDISRAGLVNFEKYEWPRILREAEVIKGAADAKLARVQRTSEITIQKFSSEMEKGRRDQVTKEKLLAKAQKDVAACDIYSPTDGILLYTRVPAMGNPRPIQIGDSVWVGQTFMEIPDTRELVIEIDVREIDVAKLKPGMQGKIELDAFPGRIFGGELVSVDALAKKDDNESVNRFHCRIKLLESPDEIHVGMSATVKITYKELEDVAVVPPNALIYKEGKSMVKKVTDGADELTEIKVGGSGIQWVEVTDGLTVGDSVVVESL